MSQFFASGGQSIGASASASVLYEYSGLIEVVCGFTHKPGQAVVHHHRRWLMPRVIVVQSLSHSLPGSSVHGIFQARILEWVVSIKQRIYGKE